MTVYSPLCFQVLLQPPEHEYENVEVIKRDKQMRKSKKASIRSFMNRLSRRITKKETELSIRPSPGSPLVSKPSKSKPSRPPIAPKPKAKNPEIKITASTDEKHKPEKPAVKPKPKYIKRGSKKSDLSEMKEIIRRYSTGSVSSSKEILPPEKKEEPDGLTNQSFNSNNDSHETEPQIKFVSQIRLTGDSDSDDDTVKFDFERNGKYTSGPYAKSHTAPPRLTPMKDHAPSITFGNLSVQSSINVDDC